MVWFYCDGCCDTIKKPKLVNHFRMCGGHAFTCVDCSRTFDRQSAQGHSTCVSEHEKYALGATKPGGYAAQGYNDGAQAAAAPAAAAAAAGGEQEVIGLQFLAERPPWRCSCCNVSCTSRDTLLGHASGVKHKRRARAALGLTNQQQQQQQQQPANGTAAAPDAEKQADAADAAADTKQDTTPPAAAACEEQDEEQQASKKQKKETKEKKRKQESDDAAAADAKEQQQQAADGDDSKNSKKSKKEKKNKKRDEAAAEPAAAAAAAKEQQDQEAGKKDKKKKQDRKSKKQQQQQPDPAVLKPLLKVARKKLKKKGSLALSKLQALLQENANGGFSTELVEAVQQQLLSSGEVQLKDATLHWQAAN